MSEVLEMERIKSQSEIRVEIDKLVMKLGTSGAWIIGVLYDPEQFKKVYNGNDMHFWQAESVEVAREILDYYVGNGMHPHSYDASVTGDWIIVY